MREPASTAAAIDSTASVMSPSANGSWPGSAPSRKLRASAGVREPAPDEDRRSHLVELERLREPGDLAVRTGFELPGSGRHRAVEGTAGVGRITGPSKSRGNVI